MQRSLSAERKAIVAAVVTHYEKRTNPSKHYVFAISVTWNNDERFEVYRQYSDFFSFHEMFPESVKTVLSLPERIIFGRSHISRVAEARLDAINKYCQILMHMHPSISQALHVWKFFSYRTGDKIIPKINYDNTPSLHPQGIPGGNMLMEEHQVIENFTGEGNTELSVKIGDVVMVTSKDPSGWYMCQKDGRYGWVPGSFLVSKSAVVSVNTADVLGFASSISNCTDFQNRMARLNVTNEQDQGVEVEAETYRAIESYEAQGPGQVSFKAGDLITVLDKMEDGWWFVSTEEIEGWAPSSYLETLSGVDEQTSIPNQGDESNTYMAIESYIAENEDELTFPKDAVLTVTQRSLDGWWQATYAGHTGLVPSSHLAPIGGQQDPDATMHQEELALKQSYKQPPRRASVMKSLKTRVKAVVPEPKDGVITDLIDFTSIKRSSGQTILEIIPEVSQSRTKSPPPDQPRKLSLSANTADVTSNILKIFAPQNTQTDFQQKSKPCSSASDQIPHQDTQDGDTLNCSKEPGTMLHNQSADYTLMTPSPAVHSFTTSPAIDIPHSSSVTTHTSPAACIDSTLSPQSSQPSAGAGGMNIQQVAEIIVNFVLASDNPELRAALKRIVDGDPAIARRL